MGTALALAAPFVLCGPIVRRVDPSSAAVFVAVQAACTVKLTVFATGPGPSYARGDTVLTGSRATVRLGEKLHVAVVKAATGSGLQPGVLYGYDLAFEGSGANRGSLFDADVVAADAVAARAVLTYAGDARAAAGAPPYPSFVTPPADPGLLRIFHGSCRRPHADGYDAFPALDPVLASAGGDPGLRPHQLVLGGDQIYADDVADPLLSMIHGHGDVPGIATQLGMPPEIMPVGTTDPPADRAFAPGSRADAMKRDAKFTSGAADSHLMSFREYACMYLMVWSGQLWPLRYPLFEDVFTADTRILQDPQGRQPGETVYDLMRAGRSYQPSAQQKAIIERYVRWQEQGIRLATFQQGLVAVRRQLANVATYMVIDDHDVTDDWNIDKSWVTNAVIGSELGKRIIRNATAAYMVFQGWGNAPDQFAEQGSPAEAGRTMLGALQGWLTAPGASDDATLRDRLGLPTAIGDDGRLARPAGALTYHFSVTWPRYQLVALDTRTWREYPAGAGHPGGLLLADQPMNDMITGGGVLAEDAVTVVAQPVALFGVPILEQLAQPLAKAFAGRYMADADDAWVASDAAVHKILARLLAATPAGADGVRRRRLVMLGGDIHFGSAERIRYSATLPYACGPNPAKPFEGVNRTEGVIAGFVSSALRNEDRLTRILNDVGYVPLLDVVSRIDLVGWANEVDGDEGKRFQAGVRVAVAADEVTGWWVSGRPAVSDIDAFDVLTRAPEWNVYVQFVHHDEGDPDVRRAGTPEKVTDPAGLPRAEALAQYLAAARNLDGYLGKWGNGKEIVGYNNLGEITFNWPAGECKSATQRLWWHLPAENRAAALTTFTVDLSYGCSLTTPPPYGGYLLRHGDSDATAGTKARYDGVDRPAELVSDRWIAQLQGDLIALGFTSVPVATGEFDTGTYWAVREFQTYARGDKAAHEPVTNVAARYSDRLEPVDVPEAERYFGPVSGVADLPTQVAVKHWKDRRWRCPVVVEAWQVAGGTPQNLAAPNVWRAGESVAADRRFYSRVVTGRPSGAGPAPPSHPELIPLGVHVSSLTAPQWAGPVVEPVSELLPEHLLPLTAGLTSGPSLAVLADGLLSADSEVAGRAAAQLSTFKVLRAAAENMAPGSAGAYFDALVAADPGVIRFGPFGWRAHGPRTAPVNGPPMLDWRVEGGEMWAYLAYLRARDRDAYDDLGGLAGLVGTPGWGRDGASLLYRDLSVSRAQATLTDSTGGAKEPLDKLAKLLELRAWHWVHRFTLGLRASDGVRRGLWTFARQRLHDLLTTAWDSPDPDVAATVPDVTGADGKKRRVRVGDIFTSERSVAQLLCWQLYRAHQLVALGPPPAGEKPEHRTLPRAATELRQVLTLARGLGPDFSGEPSGWTDDHETVLITATGQVVAADPEVATALAAVRAWPSPAGGAYTLPLTDLPIAERMLAPARGSMRMDTNDLSDLADRIKP